jgi:hypothetical protein
MASINGRVERLERLWGDSRETDAERAAAHERLNREIEGQFRRIAAALMTAPAPPRSMSPIETWTWESISRADDRAPRDTDDWWRVFWHGVNAHVARWAEDRRARQQQAQQAG